MKLAFLGGVGTVTGSMYLLQINDAMILLECGLYQGKRQESFDRNKHFDFDPARIDAVVLSHAHIDHSGNLPNLTAQGCTAPIYATHATRDLCASMLPDSGRIQESDVAYVNKKRARKGESPVSPLYTEDDAFDALEHFVGLGYSHSLEIAPKVRLTFLDAGHILGSAMVLIEAIEKDRPIRLLFSGDLGQPDLAIVRDPSPMPPADILMLESTYGDRHHEPVNDARKILADAVNHAVSRQSRIIIPAFAVGRTQELVYTLHEMVHDGQVPDIPIYVDSPLAVDVTEVFRRHPECYDRETRMLLDAVDSKDPLGFRRLKYVRDVEESKALNTARNPMMIISASGMAEAGRVQHHLKHAITNPENIILITGWQAPNTLGRRIAERQPAVRIFGEEYPLLAQVRLAYGYSAHADRNGLLNWAQPRSTSTETAFVVHGDVKPAQALAGGLRKLGYRRVELPARGNVFEL